MFLRAAEAFAKLRMLRQMTARSRPNNTFVRRAPRSLAADFTTGCRHLKRSLEIDPNFACSYNALGVALGRSGPPEGSAVRIRDSRQTDTGLGLAGAPDRTTIHRCGRFALRCPVSRESRETQSACDRHCVVVGAYLSPARKRSGFPNAANAVYNIDRNYAPIYSELGLYYEAVRDYAKAAQAFDNYLTLAPNFADSAEIRRRAQQNRSGGPAESAPTLRRDGETKRFQE